MNKGGLVCFLDISLQEAQRAKIAHLGTSFWNGTHANNDLPEKKTQT